MDNDRQSKPAWLLPALVVVVVVVLAATARKRREVVENPIVDLAVISIAVAAFWALFRVIGARLDAPGFATFFGAPTQPHPDHPTTVTDTEGSLSYYG